MDSVGNAIAIFFVVLGLLVVVSGCDESPKESVARQSEKNIEGADTTDNVVAEEKSEPELKLVSSNYVADKQCAVCHEEIWNSYQKVGMAQSAYDYSAREKIEDFENAHFYHEASNKHYEMAIEDDKFVMTRYRVGKDGERTNVHKQVADFVIGSGNHSRTYVYRDASDSLYQMPVAWYSQPKKWGMAPGFDHANHDDFSRQISNECMFCHNAYPDHEPGSDSFMSPPSFPQTLPHGIACQRCHGPGEEHVKAAEKDPQSPDVLLTIVNPSKLPAQQSEDVCNQCHLQPTTTRVSILRHFDRGAYSFRPGERLSDFQSYLELGDSDVADRFEVNHHAYRMHQSKCYVDSGGAMNCVSCHNPHSNVAASDRLAHYRSKCFQCHGSDDCLDLERGRQEDSDCVKCHMPARRSEDAIHVVMTDHKIARPSGRDDLLAPRKEFTIPDDYPVRIYEWLRDAGPVENKRAEFYKDIMRVIDKDPAAVRSMHRNLVSGGSKMDEPKIILAETLLDLGNPGEALKMLMDVSPKAKQNSSVHANLGYGLIQEGKFDLAITFLEKAVKLEPVVPEAHFNLGIAYINTEQVEKAIEQFRNATELQPNLANASLYLGAALARDEQYEAAEAEFRRLLEMSPAYPGAALSLAGALRYQDKRMEAITILENELVQQPKDAAVAQDLAVTLVEAVDASEVKPRESLDAAIKLFNLNRKDSYSRLILSVALLQNGHDKKALEALGTLNQKEPTPDQLLLTAIANSKLKKDDAKDFYERGMKTLPAATTRLQKVIARFADAAFKTGSSRTD